MQSKTTFSLLALIGLVALSAIACQPDVEDETPRAKEDTITIKDFNFMPKVLNVSVDQAVTVFNNDKVQHTVACSDTIDTGALNPGQKRTIKFSAPGEYTCQSRSDVGPNLKTKVIVK